MSSPGETGIVAVDATGLDLDPALHGAKACGLQRLMQLGLSVPPAFVVPAHVAAAIAAGVDDGVAADEFADLALAVEELLDSGQDDADLGDPLLAVRSGAPVALPGAFDTVLDVAPQAVPEAIQTVVASTRGLLVETVMRAMGEEGVSPIAVVIQRQVDGTRDERSGAGVATSRDPLTGAEGVCGSIAWLARGDAVMAGTVAVDPIATVAVRCPEVATRLRADVVRLEREWDSPVEVEFVIESGELFYLQLRSLAVPEGSDGRAVNGTGGETLLGRGRRASSGQAVGELHVDVDSALDAIEEGRPVIIALETSSPSDVPVMVRAAGVMTVLGCPESHTGVVTRSADVPAVVSVQGLVITSEGIQFGDAAFPTGTLLTVDGTRGHILLTTEGE
jgi:pyruvate,orthophosphate dikinase